MSDMVKHLMADEHGSGAIMRMLNDICDGKITPTKGNKYGTKLRGIHDDIIKPLKDALAAAKERERVLVEALIETLRSLEIASRELSHEHKLVLGGKRWGGTAIDKARAALASVKEPS